MIQIISGGYLDHFNIRMAACSLLQITGALKNINNVGFRTSNPSSSSELSLHFLDFFEAECLFLKVEISTVLKYVPSSNISLCKISAKAISWRDQSSFTYFQRKILMETKYIFIFNFKFAQNFPSKFTPGSSFRLPTRHCFQQCIVTVLSKSYHDLS